MSLSEDLRRRRRRPWLVLVAVLLVAAGAGAVWFLTRPVPDDPDVAATALARSWSRGEIAEAPFDAAAPADLDAVYTGLVEGLDAPRPDVSVAMVSEPVPGEGETTATVELDVAWDLGDGRTWSYASEVALTRLDEELTWTVAWSPTVVHPRLDDGLVLDRRRTTPARADVLAADGSPLVTNREVVDVGIEPARVEGLAALVDALVAAFADVLAVELDGAGIAADVEAADTNAFVDVITLREDDYLRVQEAIQPLPGTVFRRRTTPLAPSRDFARFTLGNAGPVTAEQIEEQPDRFVAGDVAGRSGLQAAYDERLFGTPGVEVVLAGEEVPEDPVLFADEAEPGQPVTVTLDVRVQQAADAAVEGTGFATAMAVVRPSDGHVLALANSTEAGFDLARLGQLPPGSTFKPVTTEALLAETDLDAQTPIDCPNAVEVGGRTITNAEDQQLGTVPFRTAFVNSCNTAFVALSQQLTSTSLQQAAARFGIGRDPASGLDLYTGQVPETGDAVDLAAAAIGQGRDLVSPVAMAGVMATIANGAHGGLALVLEPAPEDGDPLPEPLPPDEVALLQELTRGVVTEGTATLLADTPGGPVHGKTGTAEFAGEDGELRTHAWFVGYQGDLAFAVVVTDTPGSYGGEVAAPVAKAFLTTLATD